MASKIINRTAFNATTSAIGVAARSATRAAPKTAPKHLAASGTLISQDGTMRNRTPFTAVSKVGVQQRYSSSSAYEETTNIPNFDAYRKSTDIYTSRNFAYMIVGATGVLSAAAAKASVHDFLTNMSASADVLAMAKVEVDLTTIPEGKNIVIKWRGKPVFIRHRTSGEIAEANAINISELRDPQTDSARVKQPEWLVMLGICTHLGCVPIGEAGDYGGWFCPCHGSHYDISGRIRKGPAPLNLEIPDYTIDGDKLIVG